MSRRFYCLAGVIVVSLGVFAYIISWMNTTTTDDLIVLEQTEDFVIVQFGAEKGRLSKNFISDFEDPDFFNWFGEGKWTTMSLLSPQAKSVSAYAELRKSIFFWGWRLS